MNEKTYYQYNGEVFANMKALCCEYDFNRYVFKKLLINKQVIKIRKPEGFIDIIDNEKG